MCTDNKLKLELANLLVKNKFERDSRVIFCKNQNLAAVHKYLNEKVHLTDEGTSMLAVNIKNAVMDLLNFKSEREQSRVR